MKTETDLLDAAFSVKKDRLPPHIRLVPNSGINILSRAIGSLRKATVSASLSLEAAPDVTKAAPLP